MIYYTPSPGLTLQPTLVWLKVRWSCGREELGVLRGPKGCLGQHQLPSRVNLSWKGGFPRCKDRIWDGDRREMSGHPHSLHGHRRGVRAASKGTCKGRQEQAVPALPCQDTGRAPASAWGGSEELGRGGPCCLRGCWAWAPSKSWGCACPLPSSEPPETSWPPSCLGLSQFAGEKKKTKKKASFGWHLAVLLLIPTERKRRRRPSSPPPAPASSP